MDNGYTKSQELYIILEFLKYEWLGLYSFYVAQERSGNGTIACEIGYYLERLMLF